MSELVECRSCGASISSNAAACPQCGGASVSPKSGLVALILCFFLGWLGAHNFYLGRWGRGLIQLVLFGLASLLMIVLVGFLFYVPLVIWVFFEFVFLLFSNGRDGDGLQVRL